jgi:hypothetical protein
MTRLPIQFTTVVTIDLTENLKYVMSYLVEIRFDTMVTVKCTDYHRGLNTFLMEKIIGEEIDLDLSPYL